MGNRMLCVCAQTLAKRLSALAPVQSALALHIIGINQPTNHRLLRLQPIANHGLFTNIYVARMCVGSNLIFTPRRMYVWWAFSKNRVHHQTIHTGAKVIFKPQPIREHILFVINFFLLLNNVFLLDLSRLRIVLEVGGCIMFFFIDALSFSSSCRRTLRVFKWYTKVAGKGL